LIERVKYVRVVLLLFVGPDDEYVPTPRIETCMHARVQSGLWAGLLQSKRWAMQGFTSWS
jgi:hypothetical protein